VGSCSGKEVETVQEKVFLLRRRVRSRARQGVAAVLTLIMLALVPGPAWAQTIRDVPTDHWAYAAVQRLINEGYLTLEDNQMFRGDRPVDRYTFAVAVARVLDQVEETGGTLPRETQELLTRLATEFQEELVAWHAAREELERRTAALSADVEALTAAGGALDSILARVRELEEATAQRGQDVAALARELEQLREDLGLQTGTLDQRLAEFQNQIEGDLGVQGINIGQSLADLASRLQATSEALNQQAQLTAELEGQVAALQTSLAQERAEREALQARLEQQRQEMMGADSQLFAEIRDLANRLDVLQSTPGTVAGVQTRQLQLERQLASLQRDFDAYRLQSEEATRSLRTTSIVGVAAGLVAIIAALVSGN